MNAQARQRLLLELEYSRLTVAEFCRLTPNAPSPGSLYRWLARYRENGIAGLSSKPREQKTTTRLNDAEKDILLAWYLRPQRPSIAFCFREYQRGGGSASYKTVLRFLRSIPACVRDTHRLGKERARVKHSVYAERDYEALKPLEIVCMDHHRMDCLVQHEGSLVRPWMSAAQDLRSRKILAVRVSLQPDALVIAALLKHLVCNAGIPQSVLIDNGKDYVAKLFTHPKTGIYARLGIRVQKAQPYHGQSKPIERFFRSFTENFSKTLESYVGSNTAERPEDTALYYKAIRKQSKRKLGLSFADLDIKTRAWIHEYNETWRHTGQGMNKRTPNEVYAAYNEPRPQLTSAEARVIFSRSMSRVVQRNGITIDGITYYAPELVAYKTDTVIVRRPLFDIGSVMVYDAVHKHKICDALAETLRYKTAEDAVKAVQKKKAAENRALRALAEKARIPQQILEQKQQERYNSNSQPSTARPSGHESRENRTPFAPKEREKVYDSPLLIKQR